MIEYLAQHLWQMWAVIAVVCLILELTAGDFFVSSGCVPLPNVICTRVRTIV